ncbi:MAG TPA: phospho-N-acetylmuramoyl-pentapeptide-transferase [Bacilli bacterium]|nr:phospho-N-acetylmuramoyl-pentapeptide-transferase [Bacilli bacterium]
MNYIVKSVLLMLFSFLLAVLISIILIPILKKLKVSQIINEYLDRHNNKNNTPTMGGIIFIIPVILIIIILYLFNKIIISYNFLILLFVFTSYGIIGFIDDYLIIKRKNNKGLTSKQKLLLQIIVSIVFFYLFMISGNEPLIWIHTLGIKINIGWLYGLFILFVLVASSNAVNLTDGLDGLASGLSIICFITFGIISFNTGWLLGYEEIGLFCFILVGSLLGFLIFNMKPAKIFMGDTGSLSLGATLGTIAILTRHELLLVLIGLVFVLETLSVIIQVIYFKITKGKRIFKMAPFHHSLEYDGWSEENIVKLFWLIGLICSMLAIGFGIFL